MRIALAALVALAVTLSAPTAPAADPPLGTRIDDLSLVDVATGKAWSLAQEGREAKAVVVVFLGTQCPVSNAYLPTLNALADEYGRKGVAVVGVNPNAHDDAADTARHAAEHEVTFPVLKDADAAVASRFNADRLATSFVLDGSRTVRYRGRIDYQFERGLKRARPTANDLRDALDAVLAGREVGRPATEVVACPINRGDRGKVARPEAGVTYTKQVARIVQKNCQECHRPGEVGPFNLTTYKDAVAWSDAIREVVDERIMPPWTADPGHGRFANDRRLSDADRDALLAWVDGGCPEGDPADLPPPREFVRGWNIGTPDEVIAMNEAVSVPAQAPRGGIPYRYVLAGKPFAEDRWLQAVEVRPGNRGVVHHIIVYVVQPGQKMPMSTGGGVGDLLGMLGGGAPPDQLTGFVPGDQAFVLPAGLAKRLPKGSQLVFEMHYTPNGKAGVDRSMLGLKFAAASPEHEVRGAGAYNWSFFIPPGTADHRVTATHRVDRDVMLLSMNPHMHLRGKAFEYRLVLPDGTEDVLLSVPKYDFNWQFSYTLAEPRAVPKGSRIVCTAHFDNSPGNPNNPDPSRGVMWGEQTWDEMMIGFFEYHDAGEASRVSKSADARLPK